MTKPMHSTLHKWLEELEQEIKIVTSNEINDEAHGNMVTFGFTEHLLNEWGKDSVYEFLESCAELYKKKNTGFDMVFYSWLDEQAGHIRISAVSRVHGKLPFKCKLDLVSLNNLVNGFYSHDSGLYTNGALNVWNRNI